jgi:predicted nuclease of restriction endonuclease-like (RecB) superfamily
LEAYLFYNKGFFNKDPRAEFPAIKGFSTRNLKYKRAFAKYYRDLSFVQEVLAQISRYHNITLPKPQLDLAHEILKDPYKFDFLALEEEAKERDLENALVEHISKFLLELGTGFAFLGRQYHIEVDNQNFISTWSFITLDYMLT